MISILITAWREEKTIAKAIRCLCDPKYSGYEGEFELLLAAPDSETHDSAMSTVKELGIEANFVPIIDPKKGKPYALNMLFEKAKGDIWILTDGDVYFGGGSLNDLLEPFKDESITLVTGRPVSDEKKNTMLSYWGNLLADAANHKRMIDLTDEVSGHGTRMVKKRAFFPVSGYIYAIRKTPIRIPEDCLVDDAYISYVVFNNGGKIAYAPNAKAYVKYPKNLKDYIAQKKRSAGGYTQLWKYNIVKPETKSRTFFRELEYVWFPIKYATNIKEFFWSLMLYPVRAYQWFLILFEQRVLKKDLMKGEGWERIESTK